MQQRQVQQALIASTLIASTLIALVHSQKIDIKKYTPLCSRSDPNLNECAKAAAARVMKEMGSHMTDYGLEELSPLHIKMIRLSQGDGSATGLNMTLTESDHEGLLGVEWLSVEIDPNKNHWELHFLVPHYVIEGTCSMDGRIFMLPIEGHGYCNITSLKHDVKLIMDGVMETKPDGMEYLELKSMVVKMNFRQGIYYLTGLFSGNKELADHMLKYLNDHDLDVLDEFRPILEVIWSEIFKEILQKMFDRIPYSELLAP